MQAVHIEVAEDQLMAKGPARAPPKTAAERKKRAESDQIRVSPVQKAVPSVLLQAALWWRC